MMTREQMMDAMIRRFGFENEIVIEFCTLAEEDIPMERLVEIFTIIIR